MIDKSLIIFFGACGTGKTSLMMHLADKYVKEQWSERMGTLEYVIRDLNSKRKHPFTIPDAPPIYSNVDFILQDLHGRKVKPVQVSGCEVGINCSEDDREYKYFYPSSLIIMDEAHGEFKSKSESLPIGQRKFFNQRRHNRLQIMLASPRAMLIHKDIRGSGAYGIEVQQMVNNYSKFGTLLSSYWYCREFPEEDELEAYIKSDGHEGKYVETMYKHDGNVFELYDSFAHVGDFAPPEGGQYER